MGPRNLGMEKWLGQGSVWPGRVAGFVEFVDDVGVGNGCVRPLRHGSVQALATKNVTTNQPPAGSERAKKAKFVMASVSLNRFLQRVCNPLIEAFACIYGGNSNFIM